MLALSAVLLALAPARAAAIGDPIDEALALHITERGLDHAGQVVAKLVPERIPVEDLAGTYACSADDAVPLSYELGAMDVLISVDSVQTRAADGRIQLDLYGTLSSTASTLLVSGDCSVLTDLDDTCDLQLPTTAFSASLAISIAEADGAFDVTVEGPELAISPITNPLDNCTAASAVGTMLGQDEEAITNLILGMVEPSLADAGPSIEQSLEDALNSLDIDTSFGLGDAEVSLSLYPTLVSVDTDGVILGLGALVDTDTLSDCVDSSAGSDLGPGGWPDFGSTAGDTSLEPDAALYVGKDFADHLLYTLWASGLLCQDVGALMGGEVTTDTLGGMIGEDFAALFPEEQPLSLRTVPAEPPVAVWAEDGAPFRVDIAGLGLPLLARLDDRDSRIFEVEAAAEIGVDVALEDATFAGDTGAGDTGPADTAGADTGAPAGGQRIATALDFSGDDLEMVEVYSDLLRPGYSAGLRTLVDTALSGLIPADALPSVDLPDMMGLRLGALVWLPTDDGQWQGGFVLLDDSRVEPLEIPACSSSGLGCDGGGSDISFEDLVGCSTSGDAGCGGCEGTSCSNAGLAVGLWRGRLGMMLGLLTLLGLRRRD